MSPDDWKSLGEAVTYVLTGMGGVIFTQKLHAKVKGTPPSDPNDTGSEMLLAIEAVGDKVDRLARSVGSVQVLTNGLHRDVQQAGNDIDRISTRLGEVAGRVDILEQRIQRPM